MKHRNSWIGIAGILLLLGGLFWFLLNAERDSTLNPREIAFALEDTASVTHIRISQIQEDQHITTVDMQQNEQGIWMVNGTYRAFEPQIGHLLTTMHRLQVKEVLSGNGLESAEKILDLMHTRVEVSGADGPMKTYLVGTSTRDSRGTLMQLEGASQPFIVERPDLQGFVNPFFTIDVDIWREKLLWRAHPSDLKEIIVTRQDQPEADLRLAHEPESPWLLYPGGSIPDHERLTSYLSQFQGPVYAESFASRKFPSKLEELAQNRPDIQFTLVYAHGDRRNLVLYERADNPNSYFGWVEGEEELYTIQTFVIDRFLLSNYDFLTDPA